MNYKIWLAVAALLTATGAQAADTYFGVDVSSLDYQESGMSDSVKPKVLALKYGIQADKNLGVEFRLGTGISDGTGKNITLDTPTGTFLASDVKLGLDLMLGAYGKATLPVSDAFEIYGMAGLTSLETSADRTIAGVVSTASSNGVEFSYGAGFAFRPNDRTTLNTEYAMLVDNGDVQITALTLGFAMKF